MDKSKRKKVLCPVMGKDGKTYWLRMGSGHINGDSSINVYLDCLPVSGRLHIRDWEELPGEKRGEAGDRSAASTDIAGGGVDSFPFVSQVGGRGTT
ncbi:MAG: hypothetical protein V2A73_21420 [Pseudomonadota bacterium]